MTASNHHLAPPLPLSSATFNGVVAFAEILQATNYADESGNYPYFQLLDGGGSQYVYDDGNLTLDGHNSQNYIPSVSASADHASPSPTIYIDTTPPSFSIANVETIELTNRALVFELNLNDPLSDLELDADFNTDSNSSYHSAPTYELSWRPNGGTSITTYSGLLYDGSGGATLSNNQAAPFSFTLFTDTGTETLTADGQPDAGADYATYLENLDETTHTFTMTVTDFVGNVHSDTFEVNKGTDEFLGYLTGWDGSAEYSESDDGLIQLDNAATSASFLVSFVTAIDESTLDANDFALSYSTSSSDDIMGMSIGAPVVNTSTAADNDYLISVTGGNLPLAAGAFTLAFDANQDIQIADGETLLDLSAIDDDNKSFAYYKEFNVTIDTIAQPNHGSSSESPDIEIEFAEFATGGSTSIDVLGYKLYYTLDSSANPSTDDPYFSSLEHSGFSSSATTRTFTHDCLPILDGSSQEYSFRVVAEYTLDGNSAEIYETHINRGATASIELNATAPGYTAGADLNLPFCTRSTLAASSASVDDNFGRGLALSRDDVDEPLRNLLASGHYQSSAGITVGAIRHYARAGAEFAAGSGTASALELALDGADQFGHNLAFPTAEFSSYDLFIAGDPFYTDGDGNKGLVQLYHKTTSDDTWTSTSTSSTGNAAAGAAVAIAVNTGGAFALYGEPGNGAGRVVPWQFSSGTWQQQNAITGSSGDSLFGSAIAVSAAGDIVAVMSATAVHIYSLDNTGSLSLMHSIAASDFLGAGGAFATDVTNLGQALALQQTELDDTYLLAIGLPHDSADSGTVYGTGANNFASGSDNYGGVLLLTTSAHGSSLSASSTWRQLAYLRAESRTANGFYGSNLLFANPEQPVLFVSEPKLGYSYDATSQSITTTTNTAVVDTAKLHIYYLNTDGTNANADEHLIFSPKDIPSSNTAGYAYAFDYAYSTLALGSPETNNGGEVSLSNLLTNLDLSNVSGSAPQALSSHALNPSNSATTLSFAIRFPATVDASTIAADDFTPVVVSAGGSNTLDASTDFGALSVTGALDHWEVTLSVTNSNATSGKVYLAFADSAEINSSTGQAFDLSEFNTSNIASSPDASYYFLDYDQPALASITRFNPTYSQTNAESVTFRLSFTNELNITDINSVSDRDDLLDDYFSVVATAGSDAVTFEVADLSSSGDNGIEVAISSASGPNTIMDVTLANLKDKIYDYQDSSNTKIFSDGIPSFSIELVIDTAIADVLGDASGNSLDAGSIGSASPKDDTYSLDYQAPEVTSSSSDLADGSIIENDTTIAYTLSFSEVVQVPEAQDFQLNIDPTSASTYSGSNLNGSDQLHEIFGGNTTDKSASFGSGSGYAISPLSNSATFTLTITINEADFTDLVSEEFELSVRTSIADVYGNALPQQYNDSNSYTINFNQFVLSSYGPTINDTTTGDIADGNYTSHLNIFSFLDQVNIASSIVGQEPNFGFSFSFGSAIDPSSVDRDDFEIKLGTTPLAAGTNITLEYISGIDADGNVIEAYESYPLGQPYISVSGDTITLEYNLTNKMIEYGLDLGEELSVAIKDSNSIISDSGSPLVGGSQPTAYSIKASMPVLSSFGYVDSSSSTFSADDSFTSDYHTFTYDDGTGGTGTYYGLRLRYSFNEAIASARGQTSGTPYTAPSYAYYLKYSSANLLEYANANLLLSGSATIPDNGGDYSKFTDQGGLVQSSSSSSQSSNSWDHLIYLTEDEDDFSEQNSELNYTLLYDDDYLSVNNNLPIFLGGYGTSDYSSATTNQDGTFLFDEHGNPARIDPSWITPLDPAEGNATLALTFDTKTPVLTGVTALYVENSDNDQFIDDFNGSFGTESDVATFAFELTFDKEVDAAELHSGLVWSIDTNVTSASLDDSNVTGAVVDSGTGYFVYTTNAVYSGLYDSIGTYQIRFNDTATITDAAGNAVDTSYTNDSANYTLINYNTIDPSACPATICSYVQSPVLLSAVSVEPGTVLVLDNDTSHLASFDVLLTFSEPVSFTTAVADLSTAFDLTYQDEDGAAISVTGSDLENTIDSLNPIATSTSTTDASGTYYTEYNLTIIDDQGYWARSNYLTDPGLKNSFAHIFFEQTNPGTSTGTDALAGNITFITDFVNPTGAQATLPTAIQDGDATSGTSAIEYFLLANFTVPSLVANSATPVAADGVDNFQGDDTSIKRHVQFQLNDTDPANSLGMLFLFRTTDDCLHPHRRRHRPLLRRRRRHLHR